MNDRIRRQVHASAVALAALTACAVTYAAGAPDAAQERDTALLFAAALDQYEQGHYREAFDALAALADGGHCDAARVAHLMTRLGRSLYPVAFQVDAEHLQRWQQRPGCPPAAMARP